MALMEGLRKLILSLKFQRLLERFGLSLFKCGESDSGRKLKVTLKEYIEYALYCRDDSPLYMFEACLEEHPQAKEMMNDYKPAHIFQEDLFTELVSKIQLFICSLESLRVRPTGGF
jgi:hypothetical protein